MTPIDKSLTTIQVRHLDQSTAEAPLSTVTAATFSSSVPWRRSRDYRGKRHYSGNYWCATTGGPVDYESRLELANLIELDFSRDTAWIRAQPFLVSGMDGQRMRRHIPDYLVEAAGGGISVIDVKPTRMLHQPKVREALAWSRRVVEAAGWEYVVLTEPEPRRHANVRFLSGYRRAFQFRPVEIEAVAHAMDCPRTISAATSMAADVLGEATYARAMVLHLLWSSHLRADLSEPLQGTSIVAPAS